MTYVTSFNYSLFVVTDAITANDGIDDITNAKQAF